MAATDAIVELGPRGVRFEGPLLGVGAHSASVPCVVESVRGSLRIARDGEVVTARAVHVRAGVVHEVRASADARLVFWYFEPGALDWPELAGDVCVLGPSRRRWLRGDDARAVLLGRAERGRRAIDPRIARALRDLESEPDLLLESLAVRCGLSESRLRHLFQRAVGVPLSRYRWWLRLRHVARAVRGGRSLAAAAHDAGFSDAAHLSRTFRRTFGFAPSMLLARATLR
jgi:AraC-like DNA-binding protein